MRRIGTIDGEKKAQTFRDYLLAQDIESRVDPDDGQWSVWIYEEDRVDTAREELSRFLENPGEKKYTAAAKVAEEKRERKVREALAAKKRRINLSEKWSRPAVARLPVTIGLIAISVIITFATGFGKDSDSILPYIWITKFVRTDPATGELIRTLPEVQQGQVWRLVTPIFLHLNQVHIFFNSLFMWVIGGMVETRRGSLRYLALVLLFAVVSNLMQFYYSGPGFGGMSGVGFGLFGYAWMKGKFAPEQGIHIPPETVGFVMIFYVICLFNLIGDVANAAHTGGLITGMVLGVVTSQWKALRR